ncbi:MAG: single-stranded DNA-binding protein [Chloracidobacterium sp.]|nr:single-stranded DNA-binding protein [Chloracidobacterium sp.]
MSANISIIGNLGKTPETKITDNGTLVASFSMASNSFRNSAEGRVEKTDWFRVTAFGKQAETLASPRAKRQSSLRSGPSDL